MPVFKKEIKFAYAAMDSKKIGIRVERIGITSKAQYSEWVAPTAYIRKKNKYVCVCTDFSTGLYECMKKYELPLPSGEDILQSYTANNYFVCTCIPKHSKFRYTANIYIYIYIYIYISSVELYQRLKK